MQPNINNAGKRFGNGIRDNADGLGVGLPVLIVSMANTFWGVELTLEAGMLLAGLLASAGAKIKQAWGSTQGAKLDDY